MKTKIVKWTCLMGAMGLGLFAQPARGETETETLQKQLQELKENFDRTMREQRQVIETLQQRVDKLQAQAATNAVTPVLAATPATEVATTPPPVAAQSWTPTSPIRAGGGGTYMDFSLVSTFAAGGSTANDIDQLEMGGHDPQQNGFNVQGVELNMQGAVDTYFRGNANINFQIDQNGETSTEVEEAWMETLSMPLNLQVRAGQYLTSFGRNNLQHPHAWAFVDSPLVSGRLLGSDGVRNPGAQISWLAPTPFYSELFLGVQNSQGETAASFQFNHDDELYLGRKWGDGGINSPSDMLYSARYAASFDLSDNQTLLAGTSALFGPNSTGNNNCTQIYGVDAYWKWKPANAHGGFPFVSWQTEAMLRRVDAAAYTDDAMTPVYSVPQETLTDWGIYSQVLYGFRKGWVAGLRGDFTGRTSKADYEKLYGNDPDRMARWRITPNLTWYPSEFSKIRLQYNYDYREDFGSDNSVWLQFEFLLGAHAAHKF
jgi:hypothetical protein